MLSVGLDLHKRYSQIEAIDEGGKRRAGGRVVNEFEEVDGFFRSLGEPCRVVLEAGWNWGLMHDWLERVENVVEVQLAHPYGVRAIASAQVKTDRIDARMLGQLLRAGLIPQAHIPGRETRQLREAVRQRLFLVRLRTMLKNRIHALLDRHHIVPPPASDLFGKRGRNYLSKVELPGLAQSFLRQDLQLLETLGSEIKQTEKLLEKTLHGDRRLELLRTIPGLGALLATVVATEIDRIDRFARPAKLVAYAGLVPSTYSSGGKTSHGGLMKMSNKWLRWALVEAAWIAVRHDPYFRHQYALRHKTKGPKTAIIAVARRLAQVIWCVLTENRPYQLRQPTSKGREYALTPAALNQD
jgi:transposase